MIWLSNPIAIWLAQRVPMWFRTRWPLKRFYWQKEEIEEAKRRAAELREVLGWRDTHE